MLALPEGLRGVVVVVLDGLGAGLLEQHADVAPFLAAAPGTSIDAAFPAATATNLASIGTGLAPARHGIVGTAVRVPDADRPLVTLTWTWDRQVGGVDALEDVVPERFQPHPTVFAGAPPGVRAVTVLRPGFTTSGLTRAALRGGQVVTADDLPGVCRVAVAEASAPGATVVYAHHGDIDTAGHLHGPGSGPWTEALAAADDVLARACADLPGDVAVVVTADHGMVAVPDHGFVDVAEHPDLRVGVRFLTGDPRARHLHVRDGALDEVVDAWSRHLGPDAEVVTRDQAFDAGWFGPPPEATDGPPARGYPDEVVDRVGDVLVVCRSDLAIIHGELDPYGGRMRGQHAAPTDDELRVPALVLTR
jgi:hypothetical protein